jgi:hypothetical protein
METERRLTEHEVENLTEMELLAITAAPVYSISKALEVCHEVIQQGHIGEDAETMGPRLFDPSAPEGYSLLQAMQALYSIARQELIDVRAFFEKARRHGKKSLAVKELMNELHSTLVPLYHCMTCSSIDDKELQEATKAIVQFVKDWWDLTTEGKDLAVPEDELLGAILTLAYRDTPDVQETLMRMHAGEDLTEEDITKIQLDHGLMMAKPGEA